MQSFLLSAARVRTSWLRICVDKLILSHLSNFFRHFYCVPRLAKVYKFFIELFYLIRLLIFYAFEVILTNSHLKRVSFLLLFNLLFQWLLVVLFVMAGLHQSFGDFICKDGLLVLKIIFSSLLNFSYFLIVMVFYSVNFSCFVLILSAFGFAQSWIYLLNAFLDLLVARIGFEYFAFRSRRQSAHIRALAWRSIGLKMKRLPFVKQSVHFSILVVSMSTDDTLMPIGYS